MTDTQQIEVDLPDFFTLRVSPQNIEAILNLLNQVPAGQSRGLIEDFEAQRRIQLEALNPNLVTARINALEQQLAMLKATREA